MARTDEEQVAFWQRHLWIGVALCVVLPVIAVVRTLLSPASDPQGHPMAVYVLAAAVALPAPLLLRVPVARLLRHPDGRLFFDAWEAAGVALVATFALLDGGARSASVMSFFILLAHAALAYPPLGTIIAGAGNIAGFLAVGLIAGDANADYLFTGAVTLAVATAVCACASYNHVLMYRRTAAFAHQFAVLAERDGLTGCLNHRTFHERLQAEATITDPSHPLSLLIIDVDNFKAVNDTHGHPTGDEVLRLVGQALQRASAPDGVPGRLGGDEFALLLPSTPLAHATTIGDRLRQEVRHIASGYGCTVSIGVAATGRRGDGAGLLAEADRAVYIAKRGGRDRTATVFDDTSLAGRRPPKTRTS